MWDNIIGSHIRRTNRNLLLANLAILAGLAGWGYLSERYLYNCLQGPFPTRLDGLAGIKDAGKIRRYFVSVDGVQPMETNVQVTETSSGGGTPKVKATYFAAPIGGRLLLIKSPSATASSSYQGALVVVPNDIRAYFQNQLDAKGGKFEAIFLPYSLDATDFRTNALLALLVSVPLGGLALVNIFRAIRRMGNPELSPIVRSLQRHKEPPAATAAKIDQEMKYSPNLSCLKRVSLTSNWLLYHAPFSLTVMHWSEIVWAYQKVTKHYHSFIPLGKTYTVSIGDKYGRIVNVEAGFWKTKDSTLQFLKVLAERMPWVVIGYTGQLQQAFKKKLPEFVAAVEERRKQYRPAGEA